MVAFKLMMRNKLGNSVSQRILPEQDHSLKARFLIVLTKRSACAVFKLGDLDGNFTELHAGVGNHYEETQP